MKLFAARTFRSAVGIAVIAMVVGKGIGYLRQLLVAYYFGVSRALDIYLMAFSITSMIMVMPFVSWFEQVIVPRLIQTKESAGDEAFRDLSASIFSFSLLFAVAIAGAFLLLFPWVAPLISQGFSGVERAELRSLTLFFVPWILIIFPYTALNSVLKSMRYYDTVLFADLVVSVIAALTLFFWHSRPAILALTLAAGYLFSFAVLFPYSVRFMRFFGNPWSPRMKHLYKNFAEMTGVNQLGSLATIAERFFQSYLNPTSISGLNYASQTLTTLNDVITLDELYIVSLSSEEQRAQKLQRLIQATLLITIPLAIFLALQSQNIIQILYQRGRFDADARALTASIFSLLAANLVCITIAGPIQRMFQILDRIRYTGILYLFAAACLSLLNFLFIFGLRLDVHGMALAIVGCNLGMLLLDIYLLRKAGIALPIVPLLKYTALALLAGAVGGAASWAVARTQVPIFNILIAASLFFLTAAAIYWPVRDRIIRVLTGKEIRGQA